MLKFVVYLISFGLLFAVFSARNKTWPFRGFCLCIGYTIGDVLGYFAFYNPSILITALFATIIVFLCFSISAFYSILLLFRYK